jgi:hypothetical protein
MRGEWDNEQPISPSLLRSAMALASGLLAALAAACVVGAILQAVDGRYLEAAIQGTGGLAIPFAIWLIVRMLMDMLIIQHRSLDKFAEIAAPQPARSHPVHTHGAGAERAKDDGVSYPQE